MAPQRPTYKWDYRNIFIKLLILIVGIGLGVYACTQSYWVVGILCILVSPVIAYYFPRPRTKVVWEKGAWPFE